MTQIKIISFVFLLSACSMPYYGYTEQEWLNLTDKEREAAVTGYDEIIKEKNNQKHTDLIEQQKQKIIDRGVNDIPPR